MQLSGCGQPGQGVVVDLKKPSQGQKGRNAQRTITTVAALANLALEVTVLVNAIGSANGQKDPAAVNTASCSCRSRSMQHIRPTVAAHTQRPLCRMAESSDVVQCNSGLFAARRLLVLGGD